MHNKSQTSSAFLLSPRESLITCYKQNKAAKACVLALAASSLAGQLQLVKGTPTKRKIARTILHWDRGIEKKRGAPLGLMRVRRAAAARKVTQSRAVSQHSRAAAASTLAVAFNRLP